MVGGKVIGLARHPSGITLLHVEDTNGDTCSVRCVELPGREIDLADSVWWQMDKLMWTPAPGRAVGMQGVDFDIRLRKVGYSH